MQPQARFVNVGGAVRAPARVPFTEDMTLLAAINAAGGFNDFADQKRSACCAAAKRKFTMSANLGAIPDSIRSFSRATASKFRRAFFQRGGYNSRTRSRCRQR